MVGLFGYIENATIKDLIIKNPHVKTTGSSAGGLVGYAINSLVDRVGIQGGEVEGNESIGGIVGNTNRGTIQTLILILMFLVIFKYWWNNRSNFRWFNKKCLYQWQC